MFNLLINHECQHYQPYPLKSIKKKAELADLAGSLGAQPCPKCGRRELDPAGYGKPVGRWQGGIEVVKIRKEWRKNVRPNPARPVPTRPDPGQSDATRNTAA